MNSVVVGAFPVPVGLAAFIAFAIIAVALKILRDLYTPYPPGQALVFWNPFHPELDPQISFTNKLRNPVHKVETVDLRPTWVDIERRGERSLHFSDGVSLEIDARFHLMLDPDPASILEVVRFIGCDAAGHPDQLGHVFSQNFGAALDATARRYSSLHVEEPNFKEELVNSVRVLHGYRLTTVTLTPDRAPE